MIWLGALTLGLAIAAFAGLALNTGSKNPAVCMEASLAPQDLETFAKSLEDANGAVDPLASLQCRGVAAIFQSRAKRQDLGLALTTALIGQRSFRLGLYESHVERQFPGQSKRPQMQAILEALDTLAQDHKGLLRCPQETKTTVADYNGLEPPLISAMLLKSAIPRREGAAGALALDLSTILDLAERLPLFPASSCTAAQRYFTAMNAFVAGIHPLAKDCRPTMDGTDVVLDCAAH